MERSDSDDLIDVLEDPRDLDRLVDIFEGLTFGELQAVRLAIGIESPVAEPTAEEFEEEAAIYREIDEMLDLGYQEYQALIDDILRPLRRVAEALEANEFKFRLEALASWPKEVMDDFGFFLGREIEKLIRELDYSMRDCFARRTAYQEYVAKGGRTGFVLKAEPWTDYVHSGSRSDGQYKIVNELKRAAGSYFWEFVIQPNNDGEPRNCCCPACLESLGFRIPTMSPREAMEYARGHEAIMAYWDERLASPSWDYGTPPSSDVD